MPEHKQVEITTQFGPFEVDEGIAPLIEALHAADAFTFNSCEDNVRDCAWVEFSLFSYMHLLERAWARKKEHYSTRESYDPDFPDLYGWLEQECEQVLTYMDDGEPDENDEWVDGDELFFGLSLRFDREEIELFTAFLEPFKAE